MLDLKKQTSRALHDDHMTGLEILERVEGLLQRHRDAAPDVGENPEARRVLVDLKTMVDIELPPHFDFEEDELFPHLVGLGDGAMVELLAEEHVTLRAAWPVIADVCQKSIDGQASPEEWRKFRDVAGDFAQTLTGHIHKEEMGLLGALETMLDDAVDQDAAMTYASSR